MVPARITGELLHSGSVCKLLGHLLELLEHGGAPRDELGVYEPGVEQRLLRGRSAPGHREMVDGNRSGRHRCRECRQRVRREEAIPLVRAECNFTSVTVATQSPDSATGWSELRLRQGAPHRPVIATAAARSLRQNELSGGGNERTAFQVEKTDRQTAAPRPNSATMPPSHKLGDVTSLSSVKVRPRLNKGLNHCHYQSKYEVGNR